jgi:4-amino-4-deoxy-L-arabinose transferase-like glycosyltransferase
VAASFGFLAAVIALSRYLESRVGFYLILTGLATGLALAVKHSGILLAPAFVAIAVLEPIMVSSAQESRVRQVCANLAAVIAVALIAVGVLWISYGLRDAGRPNDARTWANERVPESKSLIATRILPALESRHLLP